MKIATWNVNSVRKRTGNLVSWLNEAQPDIVVLQEIKAQEPHVPYGRSRGGRLQGAPSSARRVSTASRSCRGTRST